MRLFAVLLAACAVTCAVSRRHLVPEFEINLDTAPQHRYDGLVPHFNESVWAFYDAFFAHDKVLADALYLLTDIRGKENEEHQQEIEGLAAASKLPLKFVQGIQMLYELQTLMVPIVNFTGPAVDSLAFLPKGLEALARIPWRGPGCTGIIATGGDGTVYHARNLDFSPSAYFAPLVYTGIFKKGGKELFRSQMVAGYSPLVTGLRKGPDGFAIERNTRFTDHKGGNKEMLRHLLEGKRPVNGWTLRKIMETEATYDSAVAAIAAADYVSTEYAIVSGVKKGTILSRDPDGVAHVQTLGQTNMEQRDDYIIITNFDFFWHDIREWFDPTGGKIGHPRRIAAQAVLNASAVLTPEVLFNAINHKGVIADTIFQALINVELGLWNVSQPDL